MHIIVPMSGIGRRFVDAGYKVPKPLIKIDGKYIIEHVCDLFPGEDKFTFICNNEHLATTPMSEILTMIRPSAKIVGIEPHKLGPVYAVSKILDRIKDDEEVIVNYCDFGTYWDYQDFLRHTRNRNAAGAIPAYKGFHPHMLGSTNYAFIRESEQWMHEIQEKKPFTDDRTQEFASNGTYYFKYGKYVKKYFQKLLDTDHTVNGEYYVSMIYNLLCKDNLPVSIYEIQHMLQWGTPEDVAEYLEWSNYFKRIIQEVPIEISMPESHINLIPMAGQGKRFQNVGYKIPKPFLSVSGKPMVVQAVNALPKTNKLRYVCLQRHLQEYPLAETLHAHHPHANIVTLSEMTEGQAMTCQRGLQNIDENNSLLIAACDNSIIYNVEKFNSLLQQSDTDAIVFTFKDHPSVKRNPAMYGFVKVENDDLITEVSVKIPLSQNPGQDHAITGVFYFRSIALYNEALNSLLEKNIKVNNEYYVDSLMGELVKLGYCVKAFLVDHYICWGTPDDFRTFEYWQSFFHKTNWHPYRLEKDNTFNLEALAEKEKQFNSFQQEYF